MPDIALVTYAASPGLTPDDCLLDDALRLQGARTHILPWDAPTDWTRMDLVVLRSPWDYYLRAAEFRRWIESLHHARVTLLNPYPVLRWNGDKRYLLELEERGILIVPTELVHRTDERTLAEILAARAWTDAVVKPVVSAGAHETWRASAATARGDEARFRQLVRSSPEGIFVQPFMPEVVADGEWSLIFIAGEYSHAAIKRPRAGDFRVQHVHGGTYAPASPPASIVADAERVVAAGAACAGVTPRDVAYARVDGVVRGGETPALLLMELEALEPSLFFLQAPDAADRMATVLIDRAVAPADASSYLR